MKQRILFLFMIVSLLFAGSGRLWAYGETTSYVLDESSEFSIGAYSNSSGVEFTLSGPGATLSFSIKFAFNVQQ